MKRSARRLLTLLLCACLITGLLPVTALAANFPSEFYASVTYKYESNTKYEIFGTVTQSADTLTYGRTGEKMDRVVYGMEYAGGVFFTVEGNKLPRNEDDGLRELRMYNSDLSSYRTIGEVNQKNGNYWIIDTAMDISGAEPLLYGTYNTALTVQVSDPCQGLSRQGELRAADYLADRVEQLLENELKLSALMKSKGGNPA